MRKLIAGNWKMNGLRASLNEIETLKNLCAPSYLDTTDIVICPPATLVSTLNEAVKETSIMVGGQDCHPQRVGAHTGDISAEMLKDAGAKYTIVGHSERRADHGECDEMVRAKAKAAQSEGLIPVICVGETKDQRVVGEAITVVLTQLESSLSRDATCVVAYEPVWAIGTGLVPTRDDIAEMHSAIRKVVGRETRILYGGSVNSKNAVEILHIDDVDGGLVGGASLKAQDFFAIIEAAQPAL